VAQLRTRTSPDIKDENQRSIIFVNCLPSLTEIR